MKLKYIKKSSQGYTIHRLLKEVWKTQEKLKQTFIDSVATNLAKYIYEIKDEFLNLSELEKANLFSEQWINHLQNNDTKAILIAYRAYLNYYKGDFRNGLKIVNIAEEIVEKKDSKEYAEILLYQGSLNRGLKEYEVAKDFYTQSYEIYTRLYPNQDNSDIIVCLNNLGDIWSMTNNFDKALNFHSHSLEMSKRLYHNQNHLFIARALHNLGSIWEFRDPTKSLNFYNQSFEMYKKLYQNEDHPNVSISLNNFGFIWRNKDFTKSLNFYNQSLEMAKRLFDNQDHPHIISVMLNLSNLLCKNPITKKKGLELLKQYKKIITKQQGKQEIENILKKYGNVGRDKSKRKRR